MTNTSDKKCKCQCTCLCFGCNNKDHCDSSNCYCIEHCQKEQPEECCEKKFKDQYWHGKDCKKYPDRCCVEWPICVNHKKFPTPPPVQRPEDWRKQLGSLMADVLNRKKTEMRRHDHKNIGYDYFGDIKIEKFIESLLSQAEQKAREEEREKANKIFDWLLGIEGDFPSRKEGDPPYYWRKILREKLKSLTPNHHDATRS